MQSTDANEMAVEGLQSLNEVYNIIRIFQGITFS